MGFALALSGGGVLGAAHFGVLRALEEASLRPEAVAGTSAGGLVAGLWSLGIPLEDLVAAGREVCAAPRRYFGIQWPGVIAEIAPRWGRPSTGLVGTERFVAALLALAPGAQTLQDWKLPTVVTSVDVTRLMAVAFTNAGVHPPSGGWQILSDAPLRTALGATMAIPGVFAGPPGQNGLVDGGVADVLPADWAYALRPGPVVTVDVGAHIAPPRHLGMLEVLGRSEAYATQTLSRLRASNLSQFLVAPDLSGLPIFAFGDYAHIVDIGYETTRRLLPQIRSFLEANS